MANKNYSKSKKKASDKNERFNERGDSRSEKFENSRRSKINDISFHARDAQLLADAANFAYSNNLGDIFNWRQPNDGEDLDSIPGVCALVLHPTIGWAQNWNDAVNIASRAFYTFIRHQNSGHANYDAPDLEMYKIGMANLDSAIEWAKRLYGMVSNYSFKNRYIPRALIEANGVDYEDLMNNLATYRYNLNLVIQKRNSLAVPKDSALYQRLRWDYAGYYYDANNPKAQIYMLVPEGFYVLGRGEDEATQLEFAKISGNYGAMPSTMLQVDGIISFLNTMLDRIWNEEDFNIMSGDILKAYGEGGIAQIDGITSEYVVNPAYEFEVLSQIQNATVYRCNVVDDLIYQNTSVDGGQIKCDLWLRVPSDANIAQLMESRMITVPYPNPTPADTMIATRLASCPIGRHGSEEGGLDFAEFGQYGTEIVTGMRICKAGRVEGIVKPVWHDGYSYIGHPAAGASWTDDYLSNVGDITRFDYHPAVNFEVVDENGEPIQSSVTRLFDVDNYTLMDASDLTKMHKLSVFTQMMY